MGLHELQVQLKVSGLDISSRAEKRTPETCIKEEKTIRAILQR
jgi:hypothetical protein